MASDIVIYGAGGLGREVACLLSSINSEAKQSLWNFIGFIDDVFPKGTLNKYGEVLGGIEVLNSWSKPLSVVVAVGSPIGINIIVSKINNPNINYPNLIAPDVLFYDKEALQMGKGNIIGFRCILSCNVTIGDFNVFNTDISVGHDTVIGSQNVFNPGSRISGNIKIGDQNFFGVSSVVLEKKKIGNKTTIGANSVIIKKTKDGCTYYGNPAIIID